MDEARTNMLYTNFNLSEAVESVILTMEAIIFEKDLTFTYEIDPDLTFRGNNEQIKQVVMILLDNGIKYTYPNGSISLSLKKRNYDILLTVSNTGPGIAHEHIERIFDRFLSRSQLLSSTKERFLPKVYLMN